MRLLRLVKLTQRKGIYHRNLSELVEILIDTEFDKDYIKPFLRIPNPQKDKILNDSRRSKI